jgi:type II secretory pathway component PulC
MTAARAHGRRGTMVKAMVVTVALLIAGLVAYCVRKPASKDADKVRIVSTGMTMVTPVRVEASPQPESSGEIKADRTPFTQRFNLQPHYSRGQLDGYLLDPADPSVLEGSGLQAGDVITIIDGMKLDEAKFARLDMDTKSLDDVFVAYERNGALFEDILSLRN